MSDTVCFELSNETQTDELGGQIAALLPAGAVVALIGPLGAGKTRFVRALCRAAGVDEHAVASPTFVLVHEYSGRLPIYHFDAYRLRSVDEFLALGPEEYFAADGWTLIEWADRIASCLPEERLEIEIQPTGDFSRRFCFRALGPQYESFVAAMEARATKN
jgi:tRNA threonylcarbamoyladenosine biosynthesis protein TsaE